MSSETWERNARARARDGADEAILPARRFIVTHFGGCYHRAAVFFDELARQSDEREPGPDMRLSGESYCADCPDHEACFTGYPCDMVRRVATPVRGDR